MRDRTTKALLFLIFLALVLNAFVMLVRPSEAADEGTQVGRYAISAYGNGWGTDSTTYGYYRIDTATGQVWWREKTRGYETRL